MIVFHACWNMQTKIFSLWAESSDYLKNFKTKFHSGNKHPFTLGNAPLAQYAAKFFTEAFVRKGTSGVLSLHLPSGRLAPQPSLQLQALNPEKLKNGTSRCWETAVLNFNGADALDFLTACPAKDSPEFSQGETLQFFRLVSVLALQYASSGSLRPEIAGTGEMGKNYRAEWTPQYEGALVDWQASVVRTAPQACFAGTPNFSAKDGTASFLRVSLDGWIRKIISKETLFEKLTTVSPAMMSAPDFFALALMNSSGEIRTTAGSVTKFREVYESWLRGGSGSENETSPLVFQLKANMGSDEPPGEGREKSESVPLIRLSWSEQSVWDFLIFVESCGELIPLDALWRKPGQYGKEFFKDHRDLQSLILRDLGKAAAVSPLVRRSLEAGMLSRFPLSSGEVYEFLKCHAASLSRMGFKTVLPFPLEALPKFREIRLTCFASETREGKGFFDYNWKIAIGDREISLEEFKQIVLAHQPLIRIRDSWAEISPEMAEKFENYFKSRPSSLSMPELLKLISLGRDPALDLPVKIQIRGHDLKTVEQVLASNPEPLPEKIPGFKGQLRDYQKIGAAWLHLLSSAGIGACLADDMGLGKTVQVIAWLLYEKHRNPKEKSPALLICPMSIVGNWAKELKRFAPSLDILIHHGKDRFGREDLKDAAAKHDVVVTTYSLLLRDLESISGVAWQYLILDEAQNIKNTAAKQTQAVKSLNAKTRVALTGTPVENRLLDLWSILDFLNPDYLGTIKEFSERYKIREEQGPPTSLETLQRLVRPIILRRLKTDRRIIRDLPEKMEMKVYCNLTLEQAALYKAELERSMQKIRGTDGLARRGQIFSTLTRLKQICDHPAHYLADQSPLPGRSGKLERLREMVEEVLAEKDKAIVFTQFVEMGQLIKKDLEAAFKSEIIFFQGEDSRMLREEKIRRFQESKDSSVMVLSLKAGGTGLNLTAASHVFHYDRWWNPAVEAQATDRAYRIGQKKNVQVHPFICVGTLEEKIDRMLEDKKALSGKLMNAPEDRLMQMNADELEAVLSLGEEAVSE